MVYTVVATHATGDVFPASDWNTYVRDNQAYLLAALPPIGAMFDYGAAAAPTGYALCDGSAISRTTYAALFAIIGTNFGGGDGSTTFNLPDARGRVMVGSGGALALAANDGQNATATVRRPQHRTSISQVPVHSNVSSTNGANAIQLDANVSTSSFSLPGLFAGTGNGNDNLDAPSYLVVNKIIRIT